MKPVLELAATGQIGRHVVAGLSSAGVPVRAIKHDLARAHRMFEAERLPLAGVEFVVARLPDESAIRAAATDCGQAFIASGDSPEQEVIEVDAARVALKQA